jgi:hypothetical protein
VSAAELELNIGRSAISQHLKDLEARLNVVLCRLRSLLGSHHRNPPPSITEVNQRVGSGSRKIFFQQNQPIVRVSACPKKDCDLS